MLAPTARGAALPDARGLQEPGAREGANCKEPTSGLNSEHMPQTLADVKSFLCEKCQKLQCSLKACSQEQLERRGEPDRRLRCVDCCRPQCVAPRCRTCKACRSTNCKKKAKKRCDGVVV